jgi:hypothetical protein
LYFNGCNPGGGLLFEVKTKYLPFFNMKMLSYAKHILTRVSFDARLFEKELRKAIKMLIADEVQDLKNWCYTNFSGEHEAILNRCFVRA